MGFASRNQCGQGLRPRHPGEAKAKTGRIAFAACCRSLHTPSKQPTAFGGWQTMRIGRIAFGVCYPSLHTPSGVLPALGRQSW